MVSITTRAGKGSPLTHAEVDANFNNLNNGKLDISAAPAGSITVDSSGRLGIGTTSPIGKVDITGTNVPLILQSTVAAANYITHRHVTSGDIAYIGNGGGGALTGGTTSDYVIRANLGSLIFACNGDNERARITSDGKVGIGTSSPGAQTESRITGSGAAPATSGTSQPNAAFRVSGTSTTGVLDIGCNSAAPWIQATDRSDLSQKYSLLLNPNGGSVGIGTTDASSLFSSSRNVRLSNASGKVSYEASVADGTNNHRVGLFVDNATGDLGLDTGSSTGSYNGLSFYIEGSKRATIDRSGRLLVGTSSAQTGNNTIYARCQVVGSSVGAAAGGIVSIGRSEAATSITTDETLGTLVFGDSGAGEYAWITCEADAAAGTNDYPGRLVFSTTADGASTPTERMRITNGGRLEAWGGTAVNSFNLATQVAAGTAYYLIYGGHSSSGAGSYGTQSFGVWSNGNVVNTNNSYGAISDVKLKENIVDANSQWDDIKALKVRKYNFKEGQTHTQIGLVAQEVELVSPGLVTESPDRDEDGNDLGTVTKSVNYSVLYMKAVKALQEAMDRIETLEAKVAALEASS